VDKVKRCCSETPASWLEGEAAPRPAVAEERGGETSAESGEGATVEGVHECHEAEVQLSEDGSDVAAPDDIPTLKEVAEVVEDPDPGDEARIGRPRREVRRPARFMD
jgi:hypothetical protein